ncbi:PepSY-associated TM helix domain-containing protein [Vreelandella utahensis]|uniref:PepSY-associated TM helix domain-containing protein n=1 Tax=Vreelandella halophila TaxID=86177 RepID=UPI00098439E4|nr:PepSY-associated TM helix domain-containing protein [Halomonas utahensis]
MVASWRESMRWQHTWVGVVLGALLFAIFWMGTLSVFDKEIDRWMMPATRLAPPESVALQSAVASARQVAPDSPRWRFMLPTSRAPQVRLYHPDADGRLQSVDLDPRTGRPLPEQGTLAGSGFIFPFHFSLHLKAGQLGYWLVGLAGMAMLTLLVSGLVVHRKPIRDLFTFRPHKRLGRANLDLHNLTGVVGLPFHFIMTLSGLIIFVNIYFPDAAALAYDDTADPQGTFLEEGLGRFNRPPAGEPGSLASLDIMLSRARAEWSGEGPAFIRVWHPGDAASYVEMRRSNQNMVRINRDQIYFDGGTGEVLYRFEAKPLMKTQRFIAGLHFIQFEHWPLRWLYFGGGLSGCVMIVTGFIFWLQARRKRHGRQGAVRVVEGLTVGSVTGLILATVAFFIANRLLPLEARWAGYERAALEVWVFFLVWLGAFVHGWLQGSNAWRGQCWAIAGLAVGAVALNAVTTGDHLLKTLAEGYWPVAGMDLVLLAGAALAAWCARRLTQRQTAGSGEVDFG